jgi:hypothetical protein
MPAHLYEIRPRKDKGSCDLISDVLPFGRLWYGGPDVVANAKHERTRAQSAYGCPGASEL